MENKKYFKLLPTELIWKIWETVDPGYMKVLRIQERQPGNDIVYETYKKVHHERIRDVGFEMMINNVRYKYGGSRCNSCRGLEYQCFDCAKDMSEMFHSRCALVGCNSLRFLPCLGVFPL